MKIGKHTVVSLDYTLKNGEGIVIDSTEGKAPLVYLHGVGGMIPGLEAGLEGKESGEELTIVVSPEEGFGTRNEEMIHVVPKSGFRGEGNEEMQVGMQVQLQTEQGMTIAKIIAIEGEDVTLDLNHPLADEELHFDVKIGELRDATEDEISHGHVHGPGGHHH